MQILIQQSLIYKYKLNIESKGVNKMSLAVIPADIEKIKRSDNITYLDTTPTGATRTWAVVGVRNR